MISDTTRCACMLLWYPPEPVARPEWPTTSMYSMSNVKCMQVDQVALASVCCTQRAGCIQTPTRGLAKPTAALSRSSWRSPSAAPLRFRQRTTAGSAPWMQHLHLLSVLRMHKTIAAHAHHLKRTGEKDVVLGAALGDACCQYRRGRCCSNSPARLDTAMHINGLQHRCTPGLNRQANQRVVAHCMVTGQLPTNGPKCDPNVTCLY
jgi:hypothetical protein